MTEHVHVRVRHLLRPAPARARDVHAHRRHLREVAADGEQGGRPPRRAPGAARDREGGWGNGAGFRAEW